MSSPNLNNKDNMTSSNPSKETKENALKKNYSFERIIKTPKENEKEKGDKEIVLSFNINLYEDEISFQVKEIKDNLKTELTLYKQNYLLNELKEISEYFSFLNSVNKIFESLKRNVVKKKDIISLEKSKVIIKFNINLDVIEEEIIINIPIVEISSTDEMNNIKETVIFLNEEKKIFKS